jgi:hypothetical protein
LWHRLNGAPWYGGKSLCRTIEGAAKSAPTSSHCPLCQPVTYQHLCALRRSLDLTNAFDIAVFAVACIAFWGCCHLGELLIDLDFLPEKHVSHSCSITHAVASSGVPYSSFFLPRTKTKPRGDTVSLTHTSCPCSPTIAFQHHLRSNASIPATAPLFSFETTDGSWSPLKHTWFLSRCNAVWKADGLEHIQGHGFRIGGTMHLLLRGVDPWIVMVQGQWSSQVFLGYWRKCKEILPLFVSFSFESRASIITTMSMFSNRLLRSSYGEPVMVPSVSSLWELSMGNPVPNDLTCEDFEQFKLRSSETPLPHSLSSVADLYT